ncbi:MULTISPECIES: ATP12 family protein [Rhodomicrobium]|uniref:ATP12 family chaperone protein n=1 Tax=Rhodomicrobium TaxID=1068 RepID=UPI000B4C1973|nr:MULTISPECIES: ATP12 family protein [Rhodomicrobium]
MKNGTHSNAETGSRFYKDVATGAAASGGWRILLDGRPVRTPGRAELVLPTLALAEAIAEEWRAQGARIDPHSMPLTKLANTAIDAVAPNLDAVAEDVVAFAGRDLTCYRAGSPETLVARQEAAWDPLLAWAETHHGARLVPVEGVMPLEQPTASLAAMRTAVGGFEAFPLTALHVMTALTGSAVIALAHAAGRLSLDESWAAAHVDEDFQAGHWGEDAEAKARRDARFADMRAASEFLRLSRAG